jgi:ubiquitin-like modifier-activating enzyme ATG7
LQHPFSKLKKFLLIFAHLPLQTVIEPAFWGTLGDYKLQTLKLDEGPLDIIGTYKSSNHPQIPGVLSLEPSSITAIATASTCTSTPPQPSSSPCTVHGQLYCLNTIERVSTFDRHDAVAQVVATIWDDIASGRALEDPSLLQRMIALVYCDLKLYKYHYWLGFPVAAPPAPYTLHSAPQTVAEYFSRCSSSSAEGSSGGGSEQIINALENYYSNNNTSSGGLFLLAVNKAKNSIECHTLTSWNQLSSEQQDPDSGLEETSNPDGLYLVSADTSNTAEYPGWSLRNALLLASFHFKVPVLRVLCLKTRKGRLSAEASIVFEVNLPPLPAENYHPAALGGWDTTVSSNVSITRPTSGPRVADLGALMDPRRLAASAVDLNLQLMRWRAAPLLDTAKIAQTRCLLLGAGTLGCSVARCLLGWGVRKITFVDNGRVAYSNPVRQSLFEFNDCFHGGKPKAIAAAEAVKRIFPDVDATGVELNIPMPGHPPAAQVESEVQRVLDSTNMLGKLVDEHDAVFMLLDTRESRWLGTLMCAAAMSDGGDGGGQGERCEKIAITAALGFESFVVMRHGASVPITDSSTSDSATAADDKQPAPPPPPPQQRLGCYFCSDVIAPANSTRDRTMDQQCTVARPGLSGIAGSLAVEVVAALLQHPEGVHAPAQKSQNSHCEEKEESVDDVDSPLGAVPHMIRGHLSGFSQTCLTGFAFQQCPACSPVVVEQYRSRGAEFVLQAVSQPRYLEDITGLSKLQREMEEQMEEIRLQKEKEEEEEEKSGGGGDGSGGEESADDWEEL